MWHRAFCYVPIESVSPNKHLALMLRSVLSTVVLSLVLVFHNNICTAGLPMLSSNAIYLPSVTSATHDQTPNVCGADVYCFQLQ